MPSLRWTKTSGTCSEQSVGGDRVNELTYDAKFSAPDKTIILNWRDKCVGKDFISNGDLCIQAERIFLQDKKLN